MRKTKLSMIAKPLIFFLEMWNDNYIVTWIMILLCLFYIIIIIIIILLLYVVLSLFWRVLACTLVFSVLHWYSCPPPAFITSVSSKSFSELGTFLQSFWFLRTRNFLLVFLSTRFRFFHLLGVIFPPFRCNFSFKLHM